MTKWITRDEEVKSQIPETDRSTKVVENLEAESRSSSILGLNWNVNTDSLIVSRRTEQEDPAKITQRIVLSFVSAVFDPLGICAPFTIRKQVLLKTNWAAMGQAWPKELSAEHSKLFSDWCSELREKRTMSINRLYFENGCTNLRLYIFTDESEEAMCIVAYLQDEAMLKLTYVRGKCRGAPIRHMTIPKLELQAAIYGDRLRKQILNEYEVKIVKIFHWTNSSTVLQWLKGAHKKQQVFVANRTAEILENSPMDQWRHVKGVENPAHIGNRGMSIEGIRESVWLKGQAWLQKDEDDWLKPSCQEKEVEAEQAISTVATETQVEFCSKSKTFNNAKFSSFIEDNEIIRVKGRLKFSNYAYNAKHPILLTVKHPVVQRLLERENRDNLNEGTEYVRNVLQKEYWIIGIRNAIQKIKSRCLKCRQRNANTIHPPMTDLPRERLDEHVFPFTQDYFGPIEVKFPRRTLKR